MALTTEIEAIGLKRAKEYLDANVMYERGTEDTNRPISLRTVNNYAVEMLKGNWRLTHQGIGFDAKGRFKDGQHRLMALVQACEEGAFDGDTKLDANSRLTIKFMVSRGLDNDIFSVLDIGNPRSSANVLAMSGFSCVTNLAAASRLLYLHDNYDIKFWNNTKVTNQQILDNAKAFRLDEYIPVGSALRSVGMIASAATVGYLICERAFPSGPHMAYVESLRDGVGLAADNPALVLRNYLIKSRDVARIRRDSFLHLALYIKTWNDFATNKRRSLVSWRTTEKFPVPIDGK